MTCRQNEAERKNFEDAQNYQEEKSRLRFAKNWKEWYYPLTFSFVTCSLKNKNTIRTFMQIPQNYFLKVVYHEMSWNFPEKKKVKYTFLLFFLAGTNSHRLDLSKSHRDDVLMIVTWKEVKLGRRHHSLQESWNGVKEKKMAIKVSNFRLFSLSLRVFHWHQHELWWKKERKKDRPN